MDQEELEQELWRLRAVEYDLEQAQSIMHSDSQAIELLQGTVAISQTMMDRLEDEKKQMTEALAAAMKVAKEQDEAIAKLKSQVEAQSNRIQRLYEELGTKDYTEYMDYTYDFRVVDKIPQVPERTRQGWRLTK